jgi:hypothetical protein
MEQFWTAILARSLQRMKSLAARAQSSSSAVSLQHPQAFDRMPFALPLGPAQYRHYRLGDDKNKKADEESSGRASSEAAL